MVVTIKEVGTFCAGIVGYTPTPKNLSGRLLEEVVELCLATGLHPNDIYGHVTDALHNQALKASSMKTVFPSQLKTPFPNDEDILEECADISLIIKHIQYALSVNEKEFNQIEYAKWMAFSSKTFKITEKGLLYAVKSHVKG